MSGLVLEARHDGRAAGRLTLEPGRPYIVGRAGDLAPDDPHLSRRHAEIRADGAALAVSRLPDSRNPLFFQGEEASRFRLGPGECFVIGSTSFCLLQEQPALDPTPALQQTMTASGLYGGRELEHLRLKDLLELTDVVRTLPPERFHEHVAGLLRLGTGALWACVASADGSPLAEDRARDSGPAYRISRKILGLALRESPHPTLYRWAEGGLQATVQAGLDWAVCAAAKVAGGSPLIFYASGRGSDERGLQEACRFAGVVADIVGRTLSLQRLENWQGRLAHYFSGPVARKILESQDLDSLRPRLAQATVLFFDIRGFSKRSETNADILANQADLRGLMTEMTGCVLGENGVVVQYIGDAILACWNVPMEDPAHVDRACRSALAMAERLAKMPGGWRCGVGMHTGEVVAGSIGSEQVWSYSVLGAVVNQASRIEGITKIVETPILVSGEVARKASPEHAAVMRVGRFQPAGMTVALDLFELSRPPLDQKRARSFARGLEAFEKGDWEAAYEALDALPPKDHLARYLKSLAETYRRHPPKDWRGVIELDQK